MEDDFSDTSSVTASTVGSDTASLASSILNYQYENGRRYHAFKAGNYIVPNDDQEQDRLDIFHHVHCLLLGGELYAAPVKNPSNVLDAGTGTGLWAIEVADKFPDAKVIATDLSAIQPGWVPPNVQFEIDDIESEWAFPHKFDYIHLRNMGGSISDWPALLKKCWDGLTPGGYIEVSDAEAWSTTDDNSLPEDCPYYLWQVDLNKAARQFGRDLNIIPRMKEIVKEAGYAEVEDHVVKLPINHWDIPQTKQEKELATYMNVNMHEASEAYSLGLFMRVLGWSRERLDKLIEGVRKDLKNPKYHMYTVVHHVYGKKPEEATQ